MDELGLDVDQLRDWFAEELGESHTLVRISDEYAAQLGAVLGVAVRRCYVSDATLTLRAAEVGISQAELVASKLPDAGAVMSGDFCEILVLLFQAAEALPEIALSPKKWRLKHDRTKPASHTDVVHFVVPHWPEATAEDRIICAEVKGKATKNNSWHPIEAAIEGCSTDRTSRLASTLVWLKERALSEDLGGVEIAHLDRFIRADEHPATTKDFRAVAVVCSSLVDDELVKVPEIPSPDFRIIVIAVPDLKDTYTSVYTAAMGSAGEAGEPHSE